MLAFVVGELFRFLVDFAIGFSFLLYSTVLAIMEAEHYMAAKGRGTFNLKKKNQTNP